MTSDDTVARKHGEGSEGQLTVSPGDDNVGGPYRAGGVTAGRLRVRRLAVEADGLAAALSTRTPRPLPLAVAMLVAASPGPLAVDQLQVEPRRALPGPRRRLFKLKFASVRPPCRPAAPAGRLIATVLHRLTLGLGARWAAHVDACAAF